ncbi:CBS domain-containing protein [Longispora albida]|uniref:CBS domain-containing protein n=1 Tax=Longispora albida TaxID=203523 RepID=UPI000368DE07|nr:CBS domain-containing protein [Longispora albida]
MKAKEIMSKGVTCVPSHETLDRAAQMMKELNVGSLPICGPDNKLMGIITDRDLVIKCMAEGKDPSRMTAADLAQGRPVWIDSNADEREVLDLMESNRIRRLPVIEAHALVGMISEADLAKHLSEQQIAEYCSAVYSAPPSPAG